MKIFWALFLKRLKVRKTRLCQLMLIGTIILLLLYHNYRIHNNEDFYEDFFIKTPGCNIAKMEVMSDEIQKFFNWTANEKISCGAPPLTVSDENFLWINQTESDLEKLYNTTVDELKCFYTQFARLTDDLVIKSEKLSFLPYGQRVKIEHEFIRVFCDNSNGTLIYVDYHAFFKSIKKESFSNEKFNVMLLGLDSLSKLNFHRTMTKTAKTITEKLNGIELHGFTKVGDNTYENLIPVLTGLTTDELNKTCLLKNLAHSFDDCHIIWNDFKEKNYETLYAEDAAGISLFNYVKAGFKKQPTDFYFRTMIDQMEKEVLRNKLGIYNSCLGYRRPIDILFEYIRKFIKYESKSPTFSFLWTTTITHDYIELPKTLDQDLSDLMMDMKGQNFLDKTLLFIYADHGMRFGKFRELTFQGMAEERLRKF